MNDDQKWRSKNGYAIASHETDKLPPLKDTSDFLTRGQEEIHDSLKIFNNGFTEHKMVDFENEKGGIDKICMRVYQFSPFEDSLVRTSIASQKQLDDNEETYQKLIHTQSDLEHSRAFAKDLSRQLDDAKRELSEVKLQLSRIKKNEPFYIKHTAEIDLPDPQPGELLTILREPVNQIVLDAFYNAKSLCASICEGAQHVDINHERFRIQVGKWAIDWLNDDCLKAEEALARTEEQNSEKIDATRGTTYDINEE